MKIYLAAILILVCAGFGLAQPGKKIIDPAAPTAREINTLSDTCEGPVYKSGETAHPAVFISRPRARLTDEARAHSAGGQMIVKAVLCRTGRVTDIQVIKGLPFGMTEQTVEAVRDATFTPAQLAGQAVSQEIMFDISFNYVGERRPLATGPLEGQIITSTEITDLDSSMSGEITDCLNQLGGAVYKKERIEQVWQRLLKAGDFDPRTSKIRIEESELGGLSVVFQMQKKTKE